MLTICALILSGCSSKEMTYKDHLDKAKEALANIEEIISNSPQTALIPIAKADTNDDQAIVDNAETATEEINEAQKDVNSMGDEAAQSEAQQEVNETKTEASETFSAAREAMENPETQTELDALQEELDKIVPTPGSNAKANTPDSSNQPNDESMRADSNNEGGGDSIADDSAHENAAAEAASAAEHGKDDGSSNDSEADYDAFKAATGVDFQPIYEDTADTPFEKPADDMLQDAEQDLRDRAKVDEPAQLEVPTFDPTAMEAAMREMTQ